MNGRTKQTMDIGWAVAAMENGEKVRRAGWREPRDWWVFLYMPSDRHDEGDGLGLEWPFFVKHWSDGNVAWAPTHADLLAKDWELA